MPQKDASIHKRQRIEQSSKVMFAWVAGASVLVGFAVVISWFLIQQIVYKEKVLAEKNTTVSTLQDNNKAVPKLKENIRVLETNTALGSAKAKADEKALQVILDALPADNNTLALGASLQTRLIGEVPNLKLESLNIDQTESTSSSDPKTPQQLSFSFAASSSDANTIKALLKRLESSVRIIDVDSIRIEKSDSSMSVSVNAHAYYLPERVIMLTKKEI